LVLAPRLELRRKVSQLQIQIGKTRIPRVLLGTSPFLGAGQFGKRALRYYQKFQRPRNIAQIIRAAIDLGVLGVQVLPASKVFEAIQIVESEIGSKLTLVGTVGLRDISEEIRVFGKFKTAAMLLHGGVTDCYNHKLVSELLNKIHTSNCLAGLVSHHPLATLRWIQKKDLTADVDLLMLPFNKLGMFMDAKPALIAKEIIRVGKPVIGKKVLAAGYLSPKDAFRFIAKSNCISAVAVGIASVKEAEETFTTAASTLFE